MYYVFDSEVRPSPDGEEFSYKQNDMAGLPKFWIGYGFVPLPPGPSVRVPVEGLNSTIPITMWNGTTDWSGTFLPPDTSEITPSAEKFLTFAFGPGTAQIIDEEPDNGVDAEQKEAPACEVCWGHMEYRPGLIPG